MICLDMDSQNQDFSSDDSLQDPTFTPPKQTRKRKSVLDDVVVPVKRTSGIEWTASKLIFTPDFYLAVEKVCHDKCWCCFHIVVMLFKLFYLV